MLIKIYLIQITDFKSDRRCTQYLFAFSSKTYITKKINHARFRIFVLYDLNDSYYVSSFVSELTSNYDLDDALWSNFAKSIWKKVNGFGKVNDFVHLRPFFYKILARSYFFIFFVWNFEISPVLYLIGTIFTAHKLSGLHL